MSLKKTENTAKNQYTITFDAPRADFDAALNTVFRRQQKKISIPGFRKGKAPRAIVEKMYGKEVFYEDAINEILPKAYEEAVKDFDKTIVSRPEFDIENIDENGVVMTAKFYVKPEVEIKDYKGIAVTKKATSVSAKEVDEELEAVRRRNSRLIEITDRPAQMEDVVNFNYEGFCEGKAFEGGKAENHDLKLGSGQFIPGFEEGLVGASVGQDLDVNVTFPKEYHAEELAGKKAVFKCHINAIKFNELPALDDDFAKDVSECDTLADYKKELKANLTKKKEDAADKDIEEQLISSLIEKLEADIPEAMFETETENFVRDYDSRLRMQGLDLQTYFKYTGLDMDTLRKQMRPDAERQVKTRLALEKIAELEKVKVSDKETEDEFKRIADAYGMEIDKVKEVVEADAVAEDLKVKKAVELVKAAAAVSAEKKALAKKTAAKDEAEDKKAPAKKPAAKKAPAKKEEAAEEKKAPAKKAPAKKAAPKADAEKKPAAKKAPAKKTSDK